jgi:hypothetical protein
MQYLRDNPETKRTVIISGSFIGVLLVLIVFEVIIDKPLVTPSLDAI